MCNCKPRSLTTATSPLSSAARWKQVTEQWQWKQRSDSVSSYDTPEGSIDLLQVGVPTLQAFTSRAFRRLRWREDKRCWESGPGLSSHTQPVVSHHMDFIQDGYTTGARSKVKVALGAAADHKVVSAVLKSKQQPIQVVPCMCGYANPDREHLMWDCPSVWQQHTDHVRWQRPAHWPLAEKKLAVLQAPSGRRGKPDTIKRSDVELVAKSLHDLAKRQKGPILMASDGAVLGKEVFDRLVSWAVVTDTVAVSGILHSIETSSYYAELFGAIVALSAIALSRVASKILIDNRAVQHGLLILLGRERVQGFTAPRYFASLWYKVFCLDLKGIASTAWVPSHGKREDWVASDPADTARWRALNDKADVAAGERAKRAYKPAGLTPPTVTLRGQQALIRLSTGTTALKQLHFG